MAAGAVRLPASRSSRCPGSTPKQAASGAGQDIRMQSHLVHQPVALWPGHAAQLLREIRLEYLSPPAQQSLTDEWKPYEIVQGMAIVPVRGILVHETAWWGWGETSYSSIVRSIMTA